MLASLGVKQIDSMVTVAAESWLGCLQQCFVGLHGCVFIDSRELCQFHLLEVIQLVVALFRQQNVELFALANLHLRG